MAAHAADSHAKRYTGIALTGGVACSAGSGGADMGFIAGVSIHYSFSGARASSV